MTRDDVLNFEKAMGVRVEDLLAIMDSQALAGMGSNQMKGLIGADMEDLLEIMRQLVKIKH